MRIRTNLNHVNVQSKYFLAQQATMAMLRISVQACRYLIRQ